LGVGGGDYDMVATGGGGGNEPSVEAAAASPSPMPLEDLIPAAGGEELPWTKAWLATVVPAIIGLGCGVVVGWSLTILDARIKHLKQIPIPYGFGLGPHQLFAVVMVGWCYRTADVTLAATRPGANGTNWGRWAASVSLVAASWGIGVVGRTQAICRCL